MGMTYMGLVGMFKSYFADMCVEKCPLVLMGGRVEGQVCADPGARTPIGASGICSHFQIFKYPKFTFHKQINVVLIFTIYKVEHVSNPHK